MQFVSVAKLISFHKTRKITEKKVNIILVTDDGWSSYTYKNIPNFYRKYDQTRRKNPYDNEIIVEISLDEKIHLADVYQLVIDECELQNYKKILLFEERNWEEFSYSEKFLAYQHEGETKNMCCKSIIDTGYLSTQPPNIVSALLDRTENFLTDIVKEKEDHLKFLTNFLPLVEKVIENNPEDAPLLQSYVDGAKKELEENNNKEL